MPPRFFIASPLIPSQPVTATETIVRHMHVLRLQTGDTVTLFNGEGGEALAHITSIEKKTACLIVKAHVPREVDPPFQVTLAQAIAGGDKMDWLIEKAVELGVHAIQPLLTEKSVVRLQGERAEKRRQHWQALVIAACEQCGRNRIPQIAPIRSYIEWVQQDFAECDGKKLLLSPRATQSLTTLALRATRLTILIGPEGGLSEKEEALALQAGFQDITLGPRILRCETAGMATLAMLNACWEMAPHP